MQPLSAVVWQLLACAKPCCCYTWPTCRYLYLCCPAWQLGDCVSVLVERYVSTLIKEDYCIFSTWDSRQLRRPLCRMPLHHWSLARDVVITSRWYYVNSIGYPSENVSSSKWHVWFASRCSGRSLSTWQMTAASCPTALGALLTFRLACCRKHSAVTATELLQPLDLACGTLFRSSCAVQTSPTNCSYTSAERKPLSGSMKWTRHLWLLICGALEKHLLTYLLTYDAVSNQAFVRNFVEELTARHILPSSDLPLSGTRSAPLSLVSYMYILPCCWSLARFYTVCGSCCVRILKKTLTTEDVVSVARLWWRQLQRVLVFSSNWVISEDSTDVLRMRSA